MSIIKKIFNKLIKKEFKGNWYTIYRGTIGSNTIRTSGNVLDEFKNWNSVCISLIINHIQQATLRLYQKGKDNQYTELEEHELLDIIRQPNELQYYSEFIEQSVLWLELSGNLFLLKLRNGNNKIFGLLPLRPDCIEIAIDKNGFPAEYIYHIPNSNVVKYTKEDIIHLKYPSPKSYIYGEPVTARIASALKIDDEIRNTEKALFENAANLDFALIVKSRLSEAEFERLETKFKEKYQGSKNAYSPLFLAGEDMQIQPLSLAPKDLAFPIMTSWIKEMIFTAYHIPVGLFENVTTVATAEQADIIFQRECILPRLKKLERALTLFAKEFDNNLLFEFDNPIPKDREYELRKNIAYIQNQVISINELRKQEGLEEVVWGNTPLIPATYINLNKNENQIQKKQLKNTTQHWLQYIQKRRLVEINLKQKIIEAFQEDRKKIKAKIKNYYETNKTKMITKDDIDTDFLPLLDEMIDYWITLLKKPATKIFLDFGKAEMESLGLQINWSIENPSIYNVVNLLLNKGVREVVGTTREELKEQLAEMIKENRSVEEMMDAIDETVDNWITGRSRAWMIARTETTKLSNAGKITADEEIQKNYNVQIMKVWASAIDERTRSFENSDFGHLEADGEEVPVSEMFVATGEELMYPGDPSGSPGNVINCRCTYTSYIQEKEETND